MEELKIFDTREGLLLNMFVPKMYNIENKIRKGNFTWKMIFNSVRREMRWNVLRHTFLVESETSMIIKR